MGNTNQRASFSLEGAMKAARGFHHAASELEAVHLQKIRPGTRISIDPAHIEQFVGRMAGAIVLEALALELVLKARLYRAAVSFGRLRDKHDHAALYILAAAGY